MNTRRQPIGQPKGGEHGTDAELDFWRLPTIEEWGRGGRGGCTARLGLGIGHHKQGGHYDDLIVDNNAAVTTTHTEGIAVMSS